MTMMTRGNQTGNPPKEENVGLALRISRRDSLARNFCLVALVMHLDLAVDCLGQCAGEMVPSHILPRPAWIYFDKLTVETATASSD